MRRHSVLARLGECVGEMNGLGVQSLYLFGSTARDEASDVDLFLDAEPTSRFDGFDLVELKAWLEQRLDAKVDLAAREGLHPRLRTAIEGEAVRGF